MPYRVIHLPTRTVLPVAPTEHEAQKSAVAHLQEILSKSSRGRALLKGFPGGRVSWEYARRFTFVERIKGGWVNTQKGAILPQPDDITDEDVCLVFVVGNGMPKVGTFDTTEEIFIEAVTSKTYDANRVTKFLILP